MNEPMVGDGDIEIELDGKVHTLVPTAEICFAISRLRGGIREIERRILALDADMIVDVLGIAMGLNPNQKKKMLPKAVFNTGLINLTGPLIDFLLIVSNGGRPIAEDEEKEDAPDPMPAS